MIPVFQTRTSTEDFGNCLEACIASILEIPLSVVPDRWKHVDRVAWRNRIEEARAAGGEKAVGDLMVSDDAVAGEERLKDWLRERGLAWLEFAFGGRYGLDPALWAKEQASTGYWIGMHFSADGPTEMAQSSHAVVYRRLDVVHNPMRGVLDLEGCGRLHGGIVLAVTDARLVVRELGPMMLPDIRGAIDDVASGRARALSAIAAGSAEGLRLVR